MTVAPYRVHRMIQDLMRDPAAAARLVATPDVVFDAYGLLDSERALLRDGSLTAMTTLGVHPNLQMKYKRLSAPAPAPGGAGPMDAYLARLEQG